MQPGTQWLTLVEVGVITRASVSTVRHWLRAKKLRSIKPGKRRLVAVQELERFLAGGK